MSENTRAFTIEIKNDIRLKGKWDIVLNNEGYVSISSIGHEDDVEYSGMVHLGDSEFQKFWDIVGKITSDMYYDNVHQLLLDSDLNGVLESLILYLKQLLDKEMDYS